MPFLTQPPSYHSACVKQRAAIGGTRGSRLGGVKGLEQRNESGGRCGCFILLPQFNVAVSGIWNGDLPITFLLASSSVPPPPHHKRIHWLISSCGFLTVVISPDALFQCIPHTVTLNVFIYCECIYSILDLLDMLLLVNKTMISHKMSVMVVNMTWGRITAAFFGKMLEIRTVKVLSSTGFCLFHLFFRSY